MGGQASTETSPRRRLGILAAMCMALVAVVASVSGLNVAQQELAAELGASQSELLWVINGYTVALAAMLLPLGAVGDRLGRKSVLMVGLVAFAATNGASAFVDSAGQLIALRVTAGVAAAMIMPATLSTITSVFPPEERGRAVGVWTGFAGAGGILGLVGSALLLESATWPWVFSIPVVLAGASIVLTLPVVPNTRESTATRFDYAGSFLSVIAIGGLILGIHEGPEQGWAAPITVAGLVAGGVGLVLFVLWELRRTEPLLDMSIFKNRKLSAGALSLTIMFALVMALFLVAIQLMQAVMGYSALKSAAGLLPMALALMAVSPMAPVVTKRLGYRATMTGALLTAAIGLGSLAMIGENPGYLQILPGLLVAGGAVALAMTPSTTAITESLSADKQGVASALNDTVREFGGAIGIALIGSILNAAYRSSVAETAKALDPDTAEAVEEGIGGALAVAGQLGPEEGLALAAAAQSAFLDGWAEAMWIAAGLAFVTAIAAAIIIPGGTREDETETDDDLDMDGVGLLVDEPATGG